MIKESSMTSHSTLRPHVKTKSQRIYVCPFESCKKCFTESGNLKTHIRTHTGERPYMCEHPGCNKAFTTKAHLKSHYFTHTGEKPHVCQICGRSYSRVGRLHIHQRTHTGEKPYSCPCCEKTFTEKGNLTTHLRTHTGEKPFKCSYPNCGKCFTTAGHLKDHERRHMNDRPFKCEICKMSFFRKTTLRAHKRLHTGDRPFVCPFEECGKAFTEKGNLKSHMKKHSTNDNKNVNNELKVPRKMKRVKVLSQSQNVPTSSSSPPEPPVPSQNECEPQIPPRLPLSSLSFPMEEPGMLPADIGFSGQNPSISPHLTPMHITSLMALSPTNQPPVLGFQGGYHYQSLRLFTDPEPLRSERKICGLAPSRKSAFRRFVLSPGNSPGHFQSGDMSDKHVF